MLTVLEIATAFSLRTKNGEKPSGFSHYQSKKEKVCTCVHNHLVRY